MSARFVNIDRDTPMLFPVDMKEWLPENSMVYFIVDAVEQLDISDFEVNERGSGSEQYPPEMMLALLIYSYATGRFSSRAIEGATYYDIAVRYICGGDRHPDHDTICDFRVRNREAYKEAFVKVLMLAREMKYLKRVGGVSVDGTKILANGSKHAAVSYGKAGELIARLEGEIEELTRKAEEADEGGKETGLTVPEELGRRKERKAKLEAARGKIEAAYEEVKQGYAEEKEEREAARRGGKKPEGRGPQRPSDQVPEQRQINFTDPDSRIMKSGNSGEFEQAYNAQAVVDTEGSLLIVGGYVTNRGNDVRELGAAVASVPGDVRSTSSVCADTGYYSEKAVQAVEREGQGPEVYCAVERTGHYRTVADLFPGEPGDDTAEEQNPAKARMRRRLRAPEGKKIYKKRKETVETVFGIIKSVMGFRRFLLRGLEKVNSEWQLVSMAYNLRRMYRLSYPPPAFSKPGY